MNVAVVERDGAVAVMTLNRPDRLNALSRELLAAIDTHRAELERDDGVRAIVITGAGDRAFCAGADINELEGLPSGEAYQLMRYGQGVFDRLAAIPKLVVAAVNGVAMGGGCELAMACDMRFAGASAQFAQPEIRLANIPGWGGTQRLPRLVGVGRAAEMILSGQAIDAQTAEAWGLANRVVDDDGLLAETVAFARGLGAYAPRAIAGAKRAIAFGLEHGAAAGLLAEAEAVARCCGTREQEAAVQAFLTRRGSAQPAPTRQTV